MAQRKSYFLCAVNKQQHQNSLRTQKKTGQFKILFNRWFSVQLLSINRLATFSFSRMGKTYHFSNVCSVPVMIKTPHRLKIKQ